MPSHASFLTAEVAASEEQELQGKQHSHPGGLFYMKQTIGNACGTIGVLHALGNKQQQVQFGEQSSSRLHTFNDAAATC